jgi:hypothetical protein
VRGALDEMLTDDVTEQELARARAMTKGIYAREREDSVSHARLPALGLFRRGRLTSQQGESALLDTVTADEVVEVARCVAVGPRVPSADLPRLDHQWVLSPPR